MSLPMDAPITAVAAKPTRFSTAHPGATVQISGKQFPYPTEVVVLRYDEEYGPQSTPALFVKMPDGTERLVPEAGHNLTVIKDPLGLFGDHMPEGAIVAKRRPSTITAVQFRGDPMAAVDIIQWTAGKVSVAMLPAEGPIPARLMFDFGGGETFEAIPGDWIVLEGERFTVIKPEDFTRMFIQQKPGAAS